MAITCSSVISRTTSPSPGSLMNRSTLGGTRMSAFSARPSWVRPSCRASEKLKFGMKGKGCAESMASGVNTGKIRCRK